ncbi:terpenoid cyclases/protein prenyltransferase alpha-alpha toroid [Globomyces pollinis-pini]|nr:terpenoid cyclases/protein prenyltransferase alpha-alpha toroid [Globomyces pollinis-pini]
MSKHFLLVKNMEPDILQTYKINQDDWSTATSEIQSEVEDSIIKQLKKQSFLLKKHAHIQFLEEPFEDGLNRWYVSLDASKPWIIYWIFHGLDLLERDQPIDTKQRAIETLRSCQNQTGGYSGGPGQLSHLATTYAAVNALAIIGTEEAYSSINRESLYQFLIRMKQSDGSFRMHESGEIDIRGSYCALSVASLLNMMTPELTSGVAEFIVRCQSYEGGLSAFPGVEAHGGYTFCGFAAMCILGTVDLLDLDQLLSWVVSRQMQCEGGFQGRTNKLVDGCYSFWQAGAIVLLETYLGSRSSVTDLSGDENPIMIELFDRTKLEQYILGCCQANRGIMNVSNNLGGLRDKPGKSPDFYHTCYCLSGLSLCQNKFTIKKGEICFEKMDSVILPESNTLRIIHPIYNISLDHVTNVKFHFFSKPLV